MTEVEDETAMVWQEKEGDVQFIYSVQTSIYRIFLSVFTPHETYSTSFYSSILSIYFLFFVLTLSCL